MLGGCGNEGKLVTSQYFTTLQQMRVWICCIYQCIARVESKGTHRFMNPSKQRVEGNWEWERMKTEDPLSTKCMFQGQPITGAVYITKADRCTSCCCDYSSLRFWENALWGNINGTCASGAPGVWSLVKRLRDGSFKKKKDLATYCFQRGFCLFLLKQQHCFGYRTIYSSLHSSLRVNETVS